MNQVAALKRDISDGKHVDLEPDGHHEHAGRVMIEKRIGTYLI